MQIPVCQKEKSLNKQSKNKWENVNKNKQKENAKLRSNTYWQDNR